jgi:hypothetical protein
MIMSRKQSFTEAARFSGLHKSVFCKLLRDHFNVAVYTLEELSKRQAKQFAKCLKSFKGLPSLPKTLFDLFHKALCVLQSEVSPRKIA